MKTDAKPWKKRRVNRPDLPLDQLNLNDLINRFNRAAIGKAGKRKEKDKDRKYLALTDKPISPNTMIWIASQLLRFLDANKRGPAEISVSILAWEVITALAKNNPGSVRQLAEHVLGDVESFQEAHRIYGHFVQICGKQDPDRPQQENSILILIADRMTKLAISEQDQNIVRSLGYTPIS
jgi:hypothetical protein